MDSYHNLPDAKIIPEGSMSIKFLDLGIDSFHDACIYVHYMPYGYNTDKDNPMILFIENKGSCTTKHGVIAKLAEELGIDIYKNVGVYKFTENIAHGTQVILDKYGIPFIPMVHCFLVFQDFRFDLTEENNNGKHSSIEEFIETKQVRPFISRKDEYLWFRDVFERKIKNSPEMHEVSASKILKAREEAIILLKHNIGEL